eukprot:SAG31_NODE_23150_length_510_cov_0.768856_1_plen_66_part_01
MQASSLEQVHLMVAEPEPEPEPELEPEPEPKHVEASVELDTAQEQGAPPLPSRATRPQKLRPQKTR